MLKSRRGAVGFAALVLTLMTALGGCGGTGGAGAPPYTGCNPEGNDALPAIPVKIELLNQRKSDGTIALGPDGAVELVVRFTSTNGRSLDLYRAYGGVEGATDDNGPNRTSVITNVQPAPEGTTLRLQFYARRGDRVGTELFAPNSPNDPACTQWGRAAFQRKTVTVS